MPTVDATVTIPIEEYDRLRGVSPAGITRVSMVLDRSGSTATIIDDLIGGVNTFLEERRKDTAPQSISMLLFDDRMEYPFTDVSPQAIPPFTRLTYQPRGSTALYDAIGNAIGRLDAVMQPADRALLLIATDGQENSSREFDWSRISALIAAHQPPARNNWTIVYVGAGLDAYKVAQNLGVRAGNTIAFAATSDGTRAVFGSISHSTTRYSSMPGAASMDNFFGDDNKGNTVLGEINMDKLPDDAVISVGDVGSINMGGSNRGARRRSRVLASK